jgi:hypothetical protein
MLLLMGLFATYMGFIYNEFFAIPLELFGSCYNTVPTIDNSKDACNDPKFPDNVCPRFTTSHYARNDFNCVYTVGMDPRWFQSS